MAKVLSSATADTTTLCYRVREAMGIKQIEFAKQLGVSRRSVQHWESGEHQPSALAKKALLALAKKHKVDVPNRVITVQEHYTVEVEDK